MIPAKNRMEASDKHTIGLTEDGDLTTIRGSFESDH
jgi:hypothetical protein